MQTNGGEMKTCKFNTPEHFTHFRPERQRCALASVSVCWRGEVMHGIYFQLKLSFTLQLLQRVVAGGNSLTCSGGQDVKYYVWILQLFYSHWALNPMNVMWKERLEEVQRGHQICSLIDLFSLVVAFGSVSEVKQVWCSRYFILSSFNKEFPSFL